MMLTCLQIIRYLWRVRSQDETWSQKVKAHKKSRPLRTKRKSHCSRNLAEQADSHSEKEDLLKE